MAEEEEEFTEESYYEEEVVEEDFTVSVVEATPAPAPPPRPVHPLFGGAGAKNALALAAKDMEKKRTTNPNVDPRPSRPVSAGTMPTKTTTSSSAATPPARPPHPLMGAGGNALHDQIKAAAAKRYATASAKTTEPSIPTSSTAGKGTTGNSGSGGASTAVGAATKAAPVRPAGSRPTSVQQGPPSLADQVALLARKKKELEELQKDETMPQPVPVAGPPPTATLSISEQENLLLEKKKELERMKRELEGVNEQQPVVEDIPPKENKPLSAPDKLKTKSVVSSTPISDGDKGSAPPSAVVATKAAKPASTSTVSMNEEKKDALANVLANAQLKSVQKEDKPKETPAPDFAAVKSKLKPTGVALDLAPPQKDDEEAKEEVPERSVAETGPARVTRVVKEPTPAPPTQTVTRVTKGDTEYEIVEYKCVCVIL